MKKLFLVIIFIMVTTGFICSQSININTPQPNSLWYKGSTMNIKWANNNCSSSNVKINIFKNSISQANFVLQLTGSNGQKNWGIPKDFPSGDYILRIKTDPAQNGCVGDSGIFIIKTDAKFAKSDKKLSTNLGIKFNSVLNKIKVTKPVHNSSHEALKVMSISWTKNFAEYSKINMDFHRQDNTVAQHLLTEYNNCGSIGWSPPQKYAIPGAKYYIRIYTKDNKYSGISGLFYVINPITR